MVTVIFRFGSFISTVTLRFPALTQTPLTFRRPVRLKLTVAPLDHSALRYPAAMLQGIHHATDVSFVRSEKVSDLGEVQFKPPAIVDLRCAFQDHAPNPDDPLDRLLGPKRGAH